MSLRTTIDDLKESIKGISGSILQEDILSDLRDIKTRVRVVDPETGEITEQDAFPFDPDKVVSVENPRTMTDVKPGNRSDGRYTGLEAIIEIIVEKTIDAVSERFSEHIIENAEVVMRERMNELESDFNSFLSSLGAVAQAYIGMGITPVTSVDLGTNLATVVSSGGGDTREIKTQTLKATEIANYDSENIG